MEESKSKEELIRQLNSLLATRDTGWSTFKTLTLAAYGYGEVTKWNLKAIKNEIKPLLRKLHAVIDCSIMTAPDWISRGSDRDHPLLLCKIRSGLQLLRSLSGLHDDDDDVGAVDACLEIRLKKTQMPHPVPDFVADSHWWWNLAREEAALDQDSSQSEQGYESGGETSDES